MNGTDHSGRAPAESGFSMLEMLISSGVFCLCMAMMAMVTTTVLRDSVQNSTKARIELELQRAMDTITMAVRHSEAAPQVTTEATGDGGGQFPNSLRVFSGNSQARLERFANEGTKMIQVNRFLKKGIRSSQAVIVDATSVKPGVRASQIRTLAPVNDFQIVQGMLVQIDGPTTFVTRVASVNSPNAAVRTVILEDALPWRVEANAMVRFGSGARFLFAGGELRHYPDSSSTSYKVLLTRTSLNAAPFILSPGVLSVNLRVTPPSSVRGPGVYGISSVVPHARPTTFVADFNPALGGKKL